jgi:hypothetical protein
MQPLPFADGKCLEAFADFKRGVYGGLDANSGRRRRRPPIITADSLLQALSGEFPMSPP